MIQIIDAHCHVFPDKIAEKSKEAVRDFYQLPMYTSGTAVHLKAEQKPFTLYQQNYQIVKQIIFTPAVTAHQTESINQFISELIQRDNSFIGFGTIHPENKNFSEILSSFQALNLRGLKLHSDFQRFNIDSSDMYPVYEEAARLNIPILFHMGDKKQDFSHPRRLARVLKDIPELTVIAAHMGGYAHWLEAFEVLPVSERLYFDISSTLAFTDRQLLMQFIQKFGTSKFFFGSDFPMWNPVEELKTLLSFQLPEQLFSDILYQNFADFMDIK